MQLIVSNSKESTMDNNNPSRRIHPLAAGAAISVMLVSLTGVAAITGLIPSSHGTPAPTPVAGSIGAASAATSPAALVEAKDNATVDSLSEEKPGPTAPQHPTYAPRAVQSSHSQARHSYASNEAVCSSCGRVEAVHAIQQAAKPSGVGVAAGAMLGGLLGNQVGSGNGRTLATVAGAVGGGYAGNEVEKRTRATTSYQVRVRMDDGRLRTFPYAQQPGWNAGDRVRVVNGHLTSRA
jgi:outer membrane lipoprotein SlyB